MATAPLQPARGQRLRSAGVGANTLSPEKLLEGIDEGKGRLKIKSGHVRFETKGEFLDSKPPPPSSPGLEQEGAWIGWTGGGYPVASFPQNSNSCERFMLIWFVLTGSLVLRVCLGYRISSSPQHSLLSMYGLLSSSTSKLFLASADTQVGSASSLLCASLVLTMQIKLTVQDGPAIPPLSFRKPSKGEFSTPWRR